MNDLYSRDLVRRRFRRFGERPAVLVVDLQKGFTDPRFELGRSRLVHDAVSRRPSF
jgi:hypothetical protein